MSRRYPRPPLRNQARHFLALSVLALGVLSGCEQKPGGSTAPAAQTAHSVEDAPALEALRRVGASLASQSGVLDLEFLEARNGVSPASIDPDDGFNWSIFYLSFAAAEPSELQLSGNLHSQTLSPENQKRQDRWQAQVCTAELIEVMQEHTIDVVYATFGRADMPVAQCQKK